MRWQCVTYCGVQFVAGSLKSVSRTGWIEATGGDEISRSEVSMAVNQMEGGEAQFVNVTKFFYDRKHREISIVSQNQPQVFENLA